MSYNIQQLISNISTNWNSELMEIINRSVIKEKLDQTEKYLNEREKIFDGQIEFFPTTNLIFQAFEYFNFEDTKVVIVGQDPYHQKGQATGLCFSVPNGIKVPPSLKNIYKELENDSTKYHTPNHGDLTRWALQGVLLLNAGLTVQEGKAGSHSKKWGFLTDEIIRTISSNLDGVIFLLWGNFAKSKKKLIDTRKHFILEATHPSPLSANRGGWFGCQHFSKTNDILKQNDKVEIKWQN